MELEDITHTIFSQPPKESNSIQLDFSDYKLDSEALFKQLLMIFTDGMKLLYGDQNGKVDLSSLTDDDFIKVKLYFRSFGFDIFYDIITIGDDRIINDVDKKNLKDHYLRLVSNGRIYIINFDFYIG